MPPSVIAILEKKSSLTKRENNKRMLDTKWGIASALESDALRSVFDSKSSSSMSNVIWVMVVHFVVTSLVFYVLRPSIVMQQSTPLTLSVARVLMFSSSIVAATYFYPNIWSVSR